MSEAKQKPNLDVSRRTLLKAGWAAPVILAVAPPLDVFAGSHGTEPPPPPPPGGNWQGLTVGYWRQEHHYDEWTNYTPTDSYNDVFGVQMDGNPTLGETVRVGGGGINNLMRQSTAALLNAAHPSVNYRFSATQIIAMVQQAILSGDAEQIGDLAELLDAENNRHGIEL